MHPYQSEQTTDLILLFPADFADSRTLAEMEARWAADADYEAQLERHVASNYGDCGHPFGYLMTASEEEAERMMEAYDPGLNR